MTKLSYEYIGTNGQTKTFTSFAAVQAEVDRCGGHYKAIYTPVYEEFKYTGKRKRIKL